MKENVDYQFVPSSENDQAWQVRLLTGEFSGCIIQYNTIRVNPSTEELRFDFSLVWSPFEEPIDVNTNIELQEHAGVVLSYIIEDALEEGTAVIGDGNEQPGTDNT